MKKDLPHAEFTERALLGTMLNSLDGLKKGLDLCERDDFYHEGNQIIFDAIKDLVQLNKAVEVPILIDYLSHNDLLSTCGGVLYISDVLQSATTDIHFADYAQDLREKSALRKALKLSDSLQSDFLSSTDILQSIEQAKSSLSHIAKGINSCDYTTLRQALTKPNPIDGYIERSNSEYAGLSGLPTGLSAVDTSIGGLSPGCLIVVGARPAMGKSAFMSQIALEVALQGKTVLLFSMEMLAKDIVARLLCSRARVDCSLPKKGLLKDSQAASLIEEARQTIIDAPLLIVDTPIVRLRDICATARRVAGMGLGLIVIDYLQLIATPRGGTRDQEVSEISRGLKALALELEVPILCASQLSRKVEERPGHRPQMSDLRESGGIEQDADQVLFLLRRDYYDPHDKPGLAELIVGKNRHGPVTCATMRFDRKTLTFGDYSPL